MKTIGVIGEYNPFHNGHAYLIREAKAQTGADYCVTVMSGCYVQRGVPAVFDQHVRGAMAVCGGADLVLELPSLYAASSARRFAKGAVTMLCRLGCVDVLAFGWEGRTDDDWQLLCRCAEILAEKPSHCDALTKQSLLEGLSYPAARSKALCALMTGERGPAPGHLETLLRRPNNILAVEYMRALKEQGSAMTCLPISRKGAAYHDTDTEQTFPSAAGLRQRMAEKGARWQDALAPYMPAQCAPLLSMAPGPLYPEAADHVLRYKLAGETPDHLAAYLDINPALANRIWQNRLRYESWEPFTDLCDTKETTRAAVRRALLHIFLDMTTDEYAAAEREGLTPFGRVLAMGKDIRPLTAALKEKASLTLISKAARAEKRLSPQALKLWKKEMLRSQWYCAMAAETFHVPVKNEYTRPIFIR